MDRTGQSNLILGRSIARNSCLAFESAAKIQKLLSIWSFFLGRAGIWPILAWTSEILFLKKWRGFGLYDVNTVRQSNSNKHICNRQLSLLEVQSFKLTVTSTTNSLDWWNHTFTSYKEVLKIRHLAFNDAFSYRNPRKECFLQVNFAGIC